MTTPRSIPDNAPSNLRAARSTSLRVLVAEDNAVNQKLAFCILQRAGHVALIVPNGREAVAAVERDRFDVVLMDVQMPVMGGFEATRLIRELEAGSGRRTPIIAVTARAMKGDREACLEAGMDGFVLKPIKAVELLETLESLAWGSPGELNAEVANGSPVEPLILDEAALMDLVSGNRELASELAGLFLADLEPRVTEIVAAVAALDADRLRSGAHALRGSAGTLRAENVSAAAGVLETIAQSRDLDGMQSALDLLKLAVASLRPRLVALAGRA